MNYYICIISDHVADKGDKTLGVEIYKSLMSKRVWGLHPRTASRAKIHKGDALLFYWGGTKQLFLGSAISNSSTYLDKSGESNDWFLNQGNYRIDLKDIEIWEKQKPIKPLLKKLSFIKNVAHWGPYLQGGVRKIDKIDYETIITSEDYSVSTENQDLDISQFLNGLDFSKYNFEPHSLPSPERIRIHELIDNIEHRWKIPNFQRYFDWKKEGVRDFLESIFDDYYVGAFLLWKTEKESPLDLIPIKGVENDTMETEYIILDGQQRMTALYYAVKAPMFGFGNSNARCYFYIDFRKFLEEENPDNTIVIKDEIIDETESFEKILFPFKEIGRYDIWINNLEDYLLENRLGISNDQVRNLRRVLEKRLKHIWREFEIPYVVLPKTIKLPQVADIFERINTKGKQLNTFDLLIARLLKYGVQLRKLWEETLSNNGEINRYTKETEKTKIYIFQTISLLNHPASSVKKEDILNIYDNLSLSSSEEFTDLWNSSTAAITQAIQMLENLREGFGVRKESDVPFSSMIPVLAALLIVLAKKQNKADCYKKLKQWYWSAVFTNAYSSGADTQMTADFIDMNLWFDDDAQNPRVVSEARRNINNLNLKIIESGGNAIYKGILSLLALEGSNDFEKNLPLELSKNNDKDHIFPKAAGAGFAQHDYIESILNMTWLSNETNNRKRAKKPSEYIREFISEKYDGEVSEFKKILRSHFIDDTAYDSLVKDDFDGFISAREKNIKKTIKDLLGIERSVEDSIEENSGGVVDLVENKLRELIDKTLTASVHDYWETLIPQGVRERVAEKIAQQDGRHPVEARTKRTGIDKLHFCDVMDYHEIITSRINWPNFEKKFGRKSETDKHFGNFKEYRNCIKHSRPMNNVTRKQGEASLEWIYSILQT